MRGGLKLTFWHINNACMREDIFFGMDVRDVDAWIAFLFLIPFCCLLSIRVSNKQLRKISGGGA